jgi:hypothetical protein
MVIGDCAEPAVSNTKCFAGRSLTNNVIGIRSSLSTPCHKLISASNALTVDWLVNHAPSGPALRNRKSTPRSIRALNSGSLAFDSRQLASADTASAVVSICRARPQP